MDFSVDDLDVDDLVDPVADDLVSVAGDFDDESLDDAALPFVAGVAGDVVASDSLLGVLFLA